MRRSSEGRRESWAVTKLAQSRIVLAFAHRLRHSTLMKTTTRNEVMKRLTEYTGKRGKRGERMMEAIPQEVIRKATADEMVRRMAMSRDEAIKLTGG